VHFAGPENGRVACGEAGTGRMAAPETIFRIASELLKQE